MLDQMPEATYRDSLLILQLLRDDLMLWFKEIQERGTCTWSYPKILQSLKYL